MKDKDTTTIEDLLDEAAALFAEIEESPPRAQIALACALFEEWLGEELLRRFTDSQKRDWAVLSKKEQSELQSAVPQAVSVKVRLACALGVLPVEALPQIRKALKTRNDALHQAKSLTPREKKEIEAAVEYFQEWALSYEPGDEEYPE